MIDLGCPGPSKLGAAFWPVPQLESPVSYFHSTWGPSAPIVRTSVEFEVLYPLGEPVCTKAVGGDSGGFFFLVGEGCKGK